MNGGTPTSAIIDKAADNADLIVHPGDLSYATSAGYIWDQWHEMISPYASRLPLMVGLGNHEYDHLTGGNGKDKTVPQPQPTPGEDSGFKPFWGNFGDDSKGECGVPTMNRFTMPGPWAAAHRPWYTFASGPVTFVMFSTEHDWQKGSEQYKWLQATLTAVDRKATPWVVVAGHRPMYTSESPTP